MDVQKLRKESPGLKSTPQGLYDVIITSKKLEPLLSFLLRSDTMMN